MGNLPTFKKAVKHDAKLRLALCGPAGSGKTYSALTIATHLGGPIAYVDTEHGSASKYADIFSFDVVEPDTFDPRDLIEMINSAAAGGYRVICIDSLSHYWMGTGGELELVDSAAKRIQGNSFAAWKTVTPIHNKLVDTLISAPIHIIVGIRTKTEWVIEKDERTGKSTPRKIGLAPIMRDGIEFEFDVCGDMDQDNNFTVTKTRCPELTGKVINRPGKDVAEILRKWLASPHPAPVSVPQQQPTPPQQQQSPAGNGGTPPSSQGQKGTPTAGAGETRKENPAPASPWEAAVQKELAAFTAADKYGKLKAFSSLKHDLTELTGADLPYYEILAKHIPKEKWRDGQPHADAFPTLGAAKAAFRELWIYLAEISAAVNTPPDDEPKMSADQFVEGLEPEVVNG